MDDGGYGGDEMHCWMGVMIYEWEVEGEYGWYDVLWDRGNDLWMAIWGGFGWLEMEA